MTVTGVEVARFIVEASDVIEQLDVTSDAASNFVRTLEDNAADLRDILGIIADIGGSIVSVRRRRLYA